MIHVEGNTALHEPVQGRVLTWERTPVPVELPQIRFELEIYIEGYRLSKDVWLYDTKKFNTLEEVLDYDFKLKMNLFDLEMVPEIEAEYSGRGWYGFYLEYTEVYEYAADGTKYHWKRNRDR